MNTSVDQYFIDGCRRCPLGGTPDCKVNHWAEELQVLRSMVLDSGLTEIAKWGAPCYTLNGKNVLMVSALKSYCCISFFKGALLSDSQNILVKPGPHSQAVRLLKFTSLADIKAVEQYIQAYINEAIAVEQAGLKVEFSTGNEGIPSELEAAFAADPLLKNAFETLTPGRQRGYLLHFSQPKQAKTRVNRIEKCTPMILAGIGLHDQYKARKR